MQILVTGGAGFIGGHLAERLVTEGHDVTVLDNFDPFYDLRLKEHNVETARETATDSRGSYEFVRGDVRDAELVESLVDDASIVFHQGGVAGVRRSVKNPRQYNEVNIDGTLNVLQAARDTDIRRVVFASSSSVYGEPIDLPYDEEDPTLPVSPYGVSKLAAERYMGSFNQVYGLPTVSIRYFTVYGPRMRPNMAISNFVSRCMNGESPVVYGDGRQTRDFTYIEDIVEGNLALLDSSAADGTVMNIGSGERIEIRQLATEIRDQIDTDLDIKFGKRHDADAEHTHADVSRARRLIDYEPSKTIRGGVSEFIDWYRANRDWYEPLVLASRTEDDETPVEHPIEQ